MKKIYTVIFGNKIVLETNEMKKAFEYVRSFCPKYKKAIIYLNGIEMWRCTKV